MKNTDKQATGQKGKETHNGAGHNRKKRLEQALRQNLLKRKQQSRQRAEQDGDNRDN